MRSLLDLTRNEIRKLCGNERVYYRGESYWENGQVHVHAVQSDGKYLEAIVVGNDDYEVIIEMAGHHIQTFCSCPAHSTYSSWCKHTVASLLQLNELHTFNELEDVYTENVDQSSQPDDVYLEKTNEVIELFKRYNEHIVSEQQRAKHFLVVEFLLKVVYLSGRTMIALEMKVGPQRTYVVKNCKQFLDNVAHANIQHFTKTFTYEPDLFQFDPKDAEIIERLTEITRNETFYKEASYYLSMNRNDRSVIIPPFATDIFSKLSNKGVEIEDLEGNVYPFKWQEGAPKLAFMLEERTESKYILHANDLNETELLPAYSALYHKGGVYKLGRQELKMLKELKQYVPLKGTLPVSEEQMEGVVSNVFPTLSKLGDVSMSESVSQLIKTPPLTVRMNADLEEERLTAQLQFHYGDILIEPLREGTNEQRHDPSILMRDVEKENRVLRLIEETPFRWNGRELFIDSEEQVYHFLYTSLPILKQEVDVYLSQALKNLIMEEPFIPETNIDIQPSSRLLEINFQMNGIEREEITTILKSVVEKKKYYRLSDGRFVSLEQDEFQSIADLFEELGLKKTEIDGEQLALPAMRALQIEDIAEQSGQSMKLGESYRQLLDRMKHPEQLEFELPALLQASLRDYQKVGFQWMKTLSYYQLGGILADDMGLGKTLQSIAYILSEKVERPDAAVLIVAPASLIYNWQNECKKFAPSLRVALAAGDQSEREAQLGNLSNADVLITSYPLLRRDISLYKDKRFDVLILDEAQAIKNHQTQTSQAVKNVHAVQRFALSGTPIENSLEELWAIFQTVMPGFFPGKQGFKKLSQEKISRMVRPFILRRMKKDVLTELPDKIETTHVSELTSAQKALYVGYLEQIQQETRQTLQSGGLQANRMKILAGLTRLRQLCCHPGTFIENYEGSAGKFEQLLEVVSEARASGQRMLIFSQFTSMLHIIRDEFDKRGYRYFYLDGKTPSRQRVEMTEQFNQGENEIFLISLKAGGTGLNLTGADTVILYDLWWNPAVDSQAIDRAYRIGQQNVVQVIRLITHGTIEEKIYELQQRKKHLVENIIQPGETLLSNLSEEEIRDLLNISQTD